MMARSPSHSPEGRELDFAAAKAVQSIASRTAASFFTSLIGKSKHQQPSCMVLLLFCCCCCCWWWWWCCCCCLPETLLVHACSLYVAVARGDLPSSAEISPNVAPLAGLLPGSPMPFDMELPEAQQQQQQVGVTARSETTSSSSSGTNLAAARASDSAHADQQQRRQRTPTSSTTSSSNESGSREGMADSTAGNGRQAPRTQEQEDILYIQRLCQMGSAQLEAEKKKVKTQLKAFDEEFFRRYDLTSVLLVT